MNKFGLITFLLITPSYYDASEKAALITLTYHNLKEQKAYGVQTPAQEGPNQKIKNNYYSVEKYFKCLMCVCYPCFWAKATQRK